MNQDLRQAKRFTLNERRLLKRHGRSLLKCVELVQLFYS